MAPLLPANTLVLRALTLPPLYGITMAGEMGEEDFLARARRALECGLKLIQVREKDWPQTRQRQLTGALIALARPHGALVLLNGSAENAPRLGMRRRALDVGGARRCARTADGSHVLGVVPHARRDRAKPRR